MAHRGATGMHSGLLDTIPSPGATISDWPDDTQGAHGKAHPGTVATEPPYSDAELGRAFEVQTALFAPLGAHARRVKIHNGPIELRAAKAPPDRTSWVHADKQYDPYMVFSAETPAQIKSTTQHKLWLPKELHEPKKKGVKNSGPKYAYTEKDIKTSHKKLAKRPRWDSEHHVMVSQGNEEVQTYVREYFDKPKRKESEGVPKVRELYMMNDRQSGWWDEASPLGEPKHTYLDNCGPWNVGGVKDQQKVSYWRKIIEKSASAPAIAKPSITDSRSHLSLAERMADVPAAQATQFWRDWVDQSKKRLPTAPEEKQRGKKGKSKSLTSPWPPDSETNGNGTQSEHTVPISSATSYGEKGREPWNNRWSVCMSKDNKDLATSHKQFFTSAQFLSGFESGHPGAYLGLKSQTWRDVAKNVTLAPCGASGRGPIGRRCLLV